MASFDPQITLSESPYSLEKVCKQVWIVRGGMKIGFINSGYRMTLIKLKSGELWVHSPVKMTEQVKTLIAEIGVVKHVVAPNSMHHLFVADYLSTYRAKLWTVPDVMKKRSDLKEARLVQAAMPPSEWAGEFFVEFVQGANLQELVFLHKPSRSLVLTDLAFNIKAPKAPHTRLIYCLLGVSEPFGPSFLARQYYLKRSVALSKSLQKIASRDFERIILSHGEIVSENARKVFNKAFKSYL